jgi:predicted nucleic-acid-binding Zn-ribbon protein
MQHHEPMGIFRKRRPYLATVHNRPFRCLACGGHEFWDREVKLNSTGMELLDLGWANQSALGLICAGCGYVHEFVGDAACVWEQDGGYPDA